MSKFFYTTVLDEKVVKRDEINTRFADITTSVNTTKFDAEQFRLSSIRYRHLQQPPVGFLWSEKSNRNRLSTGPDTYEFMNFALAASNTWYPTNCRIAYQPTGTVTNSGDDGGYGCVYAEIEHSGSCREGCLDIAIGYSTDGINYLPFPGDGMSIRTLGHNQGGLPLGGISGSIWETRQTHPWTHVDTNVGTGVGWFPNSAYNMRTVMTLAPIVQRYTSAFPGLVETPVITTVTHWALLVRVTDHTVDTFNHHCKGRIWIVTRNREV